jgi:hypothetical protein
MLTGMVTRLGTVVALVVGLGLALEQPAMAACGGETMKFVYTGSLSTSSSYGTMGTVYEYNRSSDLNCGLVSANTTFMRLSAGYLDFVEMGTRQYSSEPGRFRLFFEYHDYPAPVYLFVSASQFNTRQ